MEKQGGNMTIDIDTRLDDLIHWILNEPSYTPAQMKVKIKQLIEEEKQSARVALEYVAVLNEPATYTLINSDTKLYNETYVKELRQKLEEWKQ